MPKGVVERRHKKKSEEPANQNSQDKSKKSEEQQQKNAEKDAINRLNQLAQNASKLKKQDDRRDYEAIEQEIDAISGSAGSSHEAEKAKARAKEALKKADTQIKTSELSASLAALQIEVEDIKDKDGDSTIDSVKERLIELRSQQTQAGLENEKSLNKLGKKIEKGLEGAKSRVQRAKKHAIADSYSELGSKIKATNARRDMTKEEAQQELDGYRARLSELDQLRSQEYNLDSKNIDKAKAIVSSEIAVLEAKVPGASRKKKFEEYCKIIAGQRGTPLETLIAKVPGLSDTEGYIPKEEPPSLAAPGGQQAPATTAPDKDKTMIDVAKEKIKGAPKAIAGSVKEAFSGWSNALDTVTSTIVSSADLGSDISGIVGDSKDIQDIQGVMDELHEMDNSKAGIASSVLSGISSVLKLIKTSISLGKAIRHEYKEDSKAPTLDRQERWKIARGFLRDAVELVDGFGGTFAPLTKAIPFFNSILGLCTDGATMVLDIIDLVDSSVHIEMMRHDKNRIYERIKEKQQKYAAGSVYADAAAEQAYSLDRKPLRSKATSVDLKRKELMKQIAEQPGSNIHVVRKDSLRSRNDSVYREAQYGLGERIKAARAQGGSKSSVRVMEALEIMEEYRGLEKAQKKKIKTLRHNIEDIITGSVSITGNALKLSGEIAVATGVGAPVGGALYAAGIGVGIAGSAYGIARDAISSVYKSIRTLVGAEDNKSTTREDMAIMIMQKMEEVAGSSIWSGTKFANDAALSTSGDEKDVIREGHNVEYLHSILRRGLDVNMSDLIASRSKSELKDKISSAFGQGD